MPRPHILSILALSTLSALQPFSPSAHSSYGPQPQTYEIPANAARVHYVAPGGNPASPGSTLDAPTTLEAAIARATTGDAIILRGGTYRTGGLLFNQGVTIQPYAGEQPIIKGTLVADAGKWVAQRNGLWRIKWEKLFPAKPADWWQRDAEGRKTPPWLFNNDMVFIDGRPLKAVGWDGDVDANSYFIDYETGTIYIGADPANRLIEITAFDSALIRTIADVHGKTSDRKGPLIRGIVFTQYAYRALEFEGAEPEGPADESTFGKDITGTTLENVTITHCSRAGGYFRGDRFTMRNCLVSDTTTEGVFILSSNDCLLEKNIFTRNNVEQITGYYPALVKIFNQTHRVVCRDNLVIGSPRTNGIWYDVGNVDGVFVGNWVQDCEDGFFFEISQRAICAGNVFYNCHKGVRSLNSAGVRVYHNTFVDTVASFERNERGAVADHFGWHPATGPGVDKREDHEFVGNLLVSRENFGRELLRFEQAPALCGKLTRPQALRIDDNIYVRPGSPAHRAATVAQAAEPAGLESGAGLQPIPLIIWSPADGKDCTVELPTPETLNKLHPQFETRSRLLALAPGAIFKNPALQDYRPSRDLALPGAAPLPADIQKALGWPATARNVPGAQQSHDTLNPE